MTSPITTSSAAEPRMKARTIDMAYFFALPRARAHRPKFYLLVCAVFLCAVPMIANAETPSEADFFDDEIQVNTYTTGFQERPDVAAHNGGYIVVWESSNSAGDSGSESIQGQRYDTAGLPIGGQFQVNSYTPGDQIEPAMAAWSDGRFAVV